MPPIGSVLETCLNVDDVARSMEFYQRIFGFPKLSSDHRFCALNVSGRQVLLLFRKGATAETVTIAGGQIPGHGGSGNCILHFRSTRQTRNTGVIGWRKTMWQSRAA